MENRRSVFELTFDTDIDGQESDISIDSSSESETESRSSEVEDSDEEREEQSWKFNFRGDVQKEPFSGPEPGATVVLEEKTNELDFFELFFPASLILNIVEQTNSYADRKMRTKPDPNWRPVNPDELRAWLGLRVYMSILHLPQTFMYWSRDQLIGNQRARRVMTRDRYSKICQYFHVNDTTSNPPRGEPGHDRLCHVRPIMDELLQRCLNNYNPHRDVSVDEGMVKFRGRLAFRQYLPAKPTKYGIKVWMRADPANGYLNQFQVYTGRDNGTAPELGLAGRVVEDMTRCLWGRHHIVNMDNYFTSPSLFEKLLNNGTYARGTARHNRKCYPAHHLRPQTVKERGNFTSASKGDTTACVWKDNKLVYFLSTADNPARLDSTVNRMKRNGIREEVRAPSIVVHYNDHMNGVDMADQLRTEYSTYRTSKKWWLYLFWFLFDVAIANGFILMKESPNHQLKTKTGKGKLRTMLDFRLALAKLLIRDYTENEKASLATVNSGHYPQRGEKRGRCKQCSKGKKRREVVNTCGQCSVHLCMDCFQPWHRDLVKK